MLIPWTPQQYDITIDASLLNIIIETTPPEVLGPKPIARTWFKSTAKIAAEPVAEPVVDPLAELVQTKPVSHPITNRNQ